VYYFFTAHYLYPNCDLYTYIFLCVPWHLLLLLAVAFWLSLLTGLSRVDRRVDVDAGMLLVLLVLLLLPPMMNAPGRRLCGRGTCKR